MEWARARCCAMCLLTIAIGMFVEPAAGQNIDVSGNWSSNLGAVAFRQSGNQITGSLRFSNGGTESDTRPVGLVLSGIGKGAEGTFPVNFQELVDHLPPSGQPFVIRALPTSLGRVVVGQPSNEIRVYWGHSPDSDVKIDIPKEEAVIASEAGGPLAVNIALTYLYCSKTQEDDDYRDNIIAPAGQPAGDEPYLLLAGVRVVDGVKTCFPIRRIPYLSGVQGNGGGHPVLMSVFGESEVVQPGNGVGFQAILMESDGTDRAALSNTLPSAVGAVAAFVTTVITKNPEKGLAAFGTGKQAVAELLSQVPGMSDDDDFLGFQEVTWNETQLLQMQEQIRQGFNDRSRGVGEVVTTVGGTSGTLVVRPEALPEHQATFDYPGEARFHEEGVDYRLKFVLRFRNHNYRPYQP